MNVGARHAAVQDIAENGDVQILERTPGGRGSSSASSSACVGCSCVPSPALITGISRRSCNEIRRRRKSCAASRYSRASWRRACARYQQRFAFLQARRFGLQVHLVGAQPRGGGGKTDSRARGRLKESQRDGFAAQRGEFLQRMPLEFLERLRLVQEERLSARALSGSMPSKWRKRYDTDSLGISPEFSWVSGSGHALHEHDALFLVDLVQANFDNFGVAGLRQRGR